MSSFHFHCVLQTQPTESVMLTIICVSVTQEKQPTRDMIQIYHIQEVIWELMKRHSCQGAHQQGRSDPDLKDDAARLVSAQTGCEGLARYEHVMVRGHI